MSCELDKGVISGKVYALVFPISVTVREDIGGLGLMDGVQILNVSTCVARVLRCWVGAQVLKRALCCISITNLHHTFEMVYLCG